MFSNKSNKVMFEKAPEWENEGVNFTKFVVSEKGEKDVSNCSGVESRAVEASSGYQHRAWRFFRSSRDDARHDVFAGNAGSLSFS